MSDEVVISQQNVNNYDLIRNGLQQSSSHMLLLFKTHMHTRRSGQSTKGAFVSPRLSKQKHVNNSMTHLQPLPTCTSIILKDLASYLTRTTASPASPSVLWSEHSSWTNRVMRLILNMIESSNNWEEGCEEDWALGCNSLTSLYRWWSQGKFNVS